MLNRIGGRSSSDTIKEKKWQPYVSSSLGTGSETWAQPGINRYLIKVFGTSFRGREVSRPYTPASDAEFSRTFEALGGELYLWQAAGIQSWIATLDQLDDE